MVEVLNDDITSGEWHKAVDQTSRPEVGNGEGKGGEQEQTEGGTDARSHVVDGTVRTLRRAAHFADVEDVRREGVEDSLVESF